MSRASKTVALLGDTHGHLDDRVAAVATACDMVVHTGDVGGDSILETLAAEGARIIAVAGNNDTPLHWAGDEARRLPQLPAEAMVDLPGGTLVVVHGHRLRARDRHARLRRAHPEATAVVYGHSHRLALDTESVPWVLNPGAAGRSRTYGGPACVVLECTDRRWALHAHRFTPPPKRR